MLQNNDHTIAWVLPPVGAEEFVGSCVQIGLRLDTRKVADGQVECFFSDTVHHRAHMWADGQARQLMLKYQHLSARAV